MRHLKKFFGAVVAALMVFAMTVTPAFAVQGTNGNSGTITINDAEPGHTYNAYQVLVLESYNTDAEAYSYKANTEWADWLKSQTQYVSIDDQGYVTWIADESDAAAFAKAAIAHAKEASIDPAATEVAPAAAEGSRYSTVTFDNLNLGYYLVDTTLGSLCALDTTRPSVEMFEKNEVPPAEKEVKEDDTGNWGDENTAQIGDTVEFHTTIGAKPGAVNYILHDVMDEGLTLDAESITIEGLTKGTDASNGDYHVVTDCTDGCTFEVIFHQSYLYTITVAKDLVVEYDAVLNENATIYTIPNTNKTRLEYGNNTKPDYTPWTDTETYTFTFDIVKTDSDNQLLDGAEFELYTAQTGGTKIALVDDGNGEYHIATPEEQAAQGFKSAVIVAEDGRATVNGLDDNTTYWLEETKAPDGFNKLPGRVEVKFGDKVNISTTMTGNQWNDGDGGIHVVNKAGSLLPTTGGMGTTIFYVAGGAIVVAAAATLVYRKRMENNR